MRVGLFVTCVVDLMRPEIGFSVLKLLKQAGCDVVVPPAQTCCGQPAYNSGERAISPKRRWPNSNRSTMSSCRRARAAE